MKFVKAADDANDSYIAFNMDNVSYIEVAKASGKEIYCKVYFVGQEKPIMLSGPKYNVPAFLSSINHPAAPQGQPMQGAPAAQNQPQPPAGQSPQQPAPMPAR